MEKINKTIIITGTHHTPAYELIRQLKSDPKIKWNIFYLSHQYSTETHLNNSVIPSLLPRHFFSIDCGKFYRSSYFKTLIELPKVLVATIKSIILVHRLKPNIVISFGGYVSVPVILASALHRIPSITHEQTLTLSLSTKINSFFVSKVALSFAPSYFRPKYVVTGNLLRSDIYQPRVSKKFNQKIIPFLYVTGGNQGSDFINNLLHQLLPNLCQTFTIVHQTGNKPIPHFSHPNYIHQNYIHPNEIGFILRHSCLIISRSGANICQEIIAFAKKSILIPLPQSQQNEQLLNARWVKSRLPQSTIILDQTTTSAEKLLTSIQRLSRVKTNDPPPPVINSKLLNLIHELV